jgi:hypothetical protein
MCHVYLIFYYYTIIKYKLFISKKKLIMDYTKIPLLVKYTKQIHNSLEDSSHPDTFNTIGDIKNEIHNDDFLSLYLSKLNGSEGLYLFFSIYLYHKNGDAAKSVKYVLENLKGYRFQVFDQGGYQLEECERCNGYGREECDYCDGSGTEECRECDGSGKETCDSCDGDGEIDGEDCSQCGGSGDVNGNFQAYSSYGYFLNPTQTWQRCSWTFTNVVDKSLFLIYSMSSVAGSECLMTEFTLTEGSMPSGPGLTTAGNCLNWFSTQTDKMIFNRDYESIVTSGLTLNLDAGFSPSFATIPLNANSSTVTPWYDLSGNGNNGTLTNGPTYSSDNGGSIVFDGVDDYIIASQIFSGNMDSTNLTYNVWCYPTGASSGFGALVNQGQYNYEPAWMFNGSSFYLWYWDSTIIEANGLSQNKWYYVNVIKNGTTHTMTIYYDNTVFSQTVTSSKSGINWGDRGGNVNIYIGQNGIGEGYNGRIANVRVYNRALSATEVLQNYNAQKGRFGL